MTFGDPKWREWVLPEDQSRPIIKRALDLGINFFDTADMYSSGVSEEVVGRALKDFAPREDVVIATKVYFPHSDKPNRGGLSRKHIMDAVEKSLKRLGTDYIDLYQIHRWDNSTPIEETLEALHDLVRAGKVHYIGASSMYAWQFSKALYTSKYRNITPFVTMQNHYNLIYREEEREMIPLCKDQGIGLIPWSPLARGYLARELKELPTAETLAKAKQQLNEETLRSQTDNLAHKRYGNQLDDYEVMWRVTQLAKQKGVSPAVLSTAWVLHKPCVTAPIVGASKINHLEDAVKALEVQLTAEELKFLEEPYKPHPISGDLS